MDWFVCMHWGIITESHDSHPNTPGITWCLVNHSRCYMIHIQSLQVSHDPYAITPCIAWSLFIHYGCHMIAIQSLNLSLVTFSLHILPIRLASVLLQPQGWFGVVARPTNLSLPSPMADKAEDVVDGEDPLSVGLSVVPISDLSHSPSRQPRPRSGPHPPLHPDMFDPQSTPKSIANG